MNVYVIIEDGQHRCWQAQTAQEAIEAAFQLFVKENVDEDWGCDGVEETPLEYWNRTCFDSCALVGELANPEAANGATDTR